MRIELKLHPQETYRIPVIDGVLFIDNATLTNYVRCNRAGYYSTIRRRQPNYTKWALEYGRRIHKALEVRYTDTDATMLASPMVTEAMIDELYRLWQEPEPEGEWRNFDLACKTIERYNKQYAGEGFRVLSLPNGQQACELAFALPLTVVKFDTLIPVRDLKTDKVYEAESIAVYFTGRTDLFTEEADSTLLVTDHKTSSMSGSTIFDEYFTGAQMKGYCWAGRQLLGRRIHGARINIVGARKPTKTTPYNTFFDRQVVYYDDNTIEEWRQNFIRHVTDLVHDAINCDFPMRTTQCITKFGKCPYYNVCMLPPEQREFMIESGDYKDVTWDRTKDNQTLEKKQPVATAQDVLDAIGSASLDSIRDFIDG